MSTATLERIESFLPERSVRIEDLAEHLGLRRAELGVFRKFYGLDTLRFDPGISLLDLLRPAAVRALGALPPGRRVRYLIFAHTTQTLAPPDVDIAQEIRADLELAEADAFSMSQQACVSSLGAIDAAAHLLRADGADGGAGDYALVVTGERAFSPMVQLIPNTAIMADAGGACLVTLDGAGDLVRSFSTTTYGQYAHWSALTPEQNTEFGKLYGERLGAAISAAVDAAGLTFDEIDTVIPHNVNELAWRQTIKALDAAPEKFFLDNIARLSHTYTSDVFINYASMREAGRLVSGRNYVLASVGLGATFGAMVITHPAAS
jgi:3-oxoacyl-[acyl-carrier-protein] synthase-3